MSNQAHTESTEMYLITVYRLTRHAPVASTKEVADMLGVSAPSASEQIKRLAGRGLLHHQWREGTTLTAEGEQIALNVLRKHRLMETFLVQIAGYALDEIHDEACQLEHAMSERLANRLDALLGHPQVDPHGHPIPTQNGEVASLNLLPLAEVPPNSQVQVQQVSDWDTEQLRYLCSIGLQPGTQLTVVDVAPFEGPLTLSVAGRTVALSRRIAATVGVSRL